MPTAPRQKDSLELPPTFYQVGFLNYDQWISDVKVNFDILNFPKHLSDELDIFDRSARQKTLKM